MLAPPSAAHWLGTDNLGRDLFSRILYGARVSLFVGIGSTALSAVIGVAIGLFAGFKGGVIDAIIMRITDAFLCFPPLIFILAMSAALGPGLQNVMLSFALFGWTGFARITRGQVLLVRELPFIEAARSVGVPPLRIMMRHILPNILAPILDRDHHHRRHRHPGGERRFVPRSRRAAADRKLGQGTAGRLHLS